MMDSNSNLEGEKDRKKELEMEGVELEAIAPSLVPVGDGLRRSRKLGDLDPGNPIEDGQGEGSGDGGYTASARKRPRRQEVGEEVDNGKGAAGDDEGVSVQVNANPVKVLPSSEGTKGLAEKKKSAQLKVKAKGIKKRGGASSSSISSIGGQRDGTSTRRSELESSEVFPEEEEAHPCLFIETILDVVFKHIINQPERPRTDAAKDLQSVRLVCKTWKASATRAYRRTGAFAEFKRGDYDDRTNQLAWGPSLSDFMDMMAGCELIPVQKFKFGIWASQDEPLELFVDFFRICGPEVVSLELCILSGVEDKFLRSLRILPELNLRKLRTLEVRVLCYCESKSKNQPDIVGLVDILLTAATTLQGFGLSYPSPCSGFSYPEQQLIVVEQLGQAIATSVPVSLKQLKLSLELTESAFGNLAESGLKLERFEFAVASKLGSRTLYKFIQSQAPTLTALRIWGHRGQLNRGVIGGTDLNIELSRLDELLELELSDVILSTTTAAASIDLANFFPKLHRLNLSETGSENAFRALLSSVRKPVESLNILHFPVWDRASLAPLVKIAARAFPSVMELHIGPQLGTRETMEDVFKYFNGLQSLHVSISEWIRKSHFVDSVFSGTSERDVARIKRTKDFGTVNLHAFQAKPSIHNLTRLRKLVVKMCFLGNQFIAFTDFSAHFIFLEMDSLREIELAAKDVRISPRYRNLLREKLVFRD